MPDTDYTPDLGVVPMPSKKRPLLLVHFDNVQFHCDWWVFRRTVYDLTFDGKCTQHGKKCYLNPMGT